MSFYKMKQTDYSSEIVSWFLPEIDQDGYFTTKVDLILILCDTTIYHMQTCNICTPIDQEQSSCCTLHNRHIKFIRAGILYTESQRLMKQ